MVVLCILKTNFEFELKFSSCVFNYTYILLNFRNPVFSITFGRKRLTNTTSTFVQSVFKNAYMERMHG